MNLHKIIILMACAFVLAGMLSAARTRTVTKEEITHMEMKEKLEQKILSFELANYAEDGTKKWKLKGDSADILAKIVNLSNIYMETFDDPKINLTALLGTYDKSNKEITLFKDVIVITSDGGILTTDYLKWNGKNDTITTDEPVQMIKGDVITDGIGALAMPQLKKIIIDKDVKVLLTTDRIDDIGTTWGTEENDEAEEKKKSKVIITCNGPLVVDYEDNIAIFEDNVIVDDKKGQIYSDKMEAYLDPTTKNIVKVIAEGEVRVVRGGDSTYSQKAIYTTEDRKIILIGRPRIQIQATDEIEKMEDKLSGI